MYKRRDVPYTNTISATLASGSTLLEDKQSQDPVVPCFCSDGTSAT